MELGIRIVRYVIGVVLAVATAYLLSVFFYTQAVLNALGSVGAEISLGDRFSQFFANVGGMTQSAFPGFVGGYISTYFEAVLAGLAVAFVVALLVTLVVRLLPEAISRPLLLIAYPAAGAAAMLVIVLSIHSITDAGLFAGAQRAGGVTLQALAGLLGGVVLALIARPAPRRAEGAPAV